VLFLLEYLFLTGLFGRGCAFQTLERGPRSRKRGVGYEEKGQLFFLGSVVLLLTGTHSLTAAIERSAYIYVIQVRDE